MIEDAAEAIGDAIDTAMATAFPTTTVDVYRAEPETAAAPCVWLTFVEARYAQARWAIVFEATVVADAGLAATDAQRQLARMTDALLDMECPGVLAVDMVARGGGLTTRIGEVPHPVHLVTIPQLTQSC